MPTPSPPGTDASGWMLSVVFTAVVGSFLATTLITQATSTAVGSLSDSIVYNSSPSIQRLASLRASTLEVELVLSRYLHGEGSRSAPASQLDSSLDRLKSGVQGYIEQPRISELQQAWVRFDELVKGTRSEADAGRYIEARQTFAGAVNPAGIRLVDSAVRAIEFNAQNGRVLASRIKETRHRTIWLMSMLTACCAVLGIAGALLIHRQARIRRNLVEAHSKFLEARAAELEQFAGRVAHDIRNPLSTASISATVTRPIRAMR